MKLYILFAMAPLIVCAADDPYAAGGHGGTPAGYYGDAVQDEGKSSLRFAPTNTAAEEVHSATPGTYVRESHGSFRCEGTRMELGTLKYHSLPNLYRV
jgi:hypothetical protein